MEDAATAPPDIVADSIGWDVATWSRALSFWLDHGTVGAGARTLEIGAGASNAGLTLWLAHRGHEVTCTSLTPPRRTTRELHRRYGVDTRISYAEVDVLDMPYRAEFDLVVFKSVLGRVGGGGRSDLQDQAMANIARALRPGGQVWFAENAAASPVHRVARRYCGAGRGGWTYPSLADLPRLLAPFAEPQWETFGVTSAFGRTERQRRRLARTDAALLHRVVPPRWCYVMACVASAP